MTVKLLRTGGMLTSVAAYGGYSAGSRHSAGVVVGWRLAHHPGTLTHAIVRRGAPLLFSEAPDSKGSIPHPKS